ncbi:MAG TPA: IucA/IucC family C-terminal-domain containing protein [Micromonosporaceae bacterium]|nr:IucA/IucC family C-terminal-domain containing protein [Micromonosporaceae bacterium]
MSVRTATAGLAATAGAVRQELARAAPELVPAFRAALPAAAAVVGRRLLEALHREGLLGAGRDPHAAFGRVECPVTPADPAALLEPLHHPARDQLAAEVTDASVNLALAYARRPAVEARARAAAAEAQAYDLLGCAAALPDDDYAVLLERLATEGHNLHPCGRTRLGWAPRDVLAHDLETPGTAVRLAAVRHTAHRGDDIGAALRASYPWLPAAPPGYRVQPLHAWQLDHLLRHRPDLSGLLHPLDAPELPAVPTGALRTLLLPPAGAGSRPYRSAPERGPGGAPGTGGPPGCRYLKLSLDIQVTSTRRTISVASTRNGPVVSALLARVLAGEPAGHRVVLLAEPAGAALDAGAGRDRDAAAILRQGLAGRLGPGEVAVPAAALTARSPLTGGTLLSELVDRYAATRGRGCRAGAALAFLTEYAALLLPPVLTLCTRYGVGFEAHLQNCLPTFVAGAPHRMVLRDLAGLRLHLPRLRARGLAPRLWPGSVVATTDVDVLRAKVAYTAFQAHLGELVLALRGSHGLDEPAAWRVVRGVVDEAYAGLAGDRASAAAARADHAFLTAPRVPHKALVRMRLAGGGDCYVPVHNPLHGR